MFQVKGKHAICSSIGDAEKHEGFKKLSKSKRVEKLQECYDLYGIRSNEFFVFVKPFIIWTVYRALRGMPATEYLEDLVNTAYEELIIAFEGGITTHYNEEVYKEPIYGTDYYYQKYKNIGEFIMAVVSSSTAKYRSKYFKRKVTHEDDSQDISERISFTDFENRYNLDYQVVDPEVLRLFTYFKVNDEFAKHLSILKQAKPRNNIMYLFMLWKEAAFE